MNMKIPAFMDPFIVEVNGKQYKYPAGTEQDVPAEVAAVIENINDMMPKPAGGSGAAGGVMIVNAVTTDGYSYNTDKTYAAIEAAINAGTEVKVAAYTEGDSTKAWYTLTGTEDGCIYFVSIKDLGLTGIGISTMGVYSDGSVSIDDAEVSKNNPW